MEREQSIDMDFNNEYSATTAMKIFSFMVVAMMLLDAYVMPGLSFLSCGEFAFILLSPYFFLKCNSIFRVERKHFTILAYLIYGFCVSSFAMISISGAALDVLTRIIREAFYFIIIFVFGKQFFRMDIFKKWLSRFVMLLAVFVILQALVYYAFGYLIPGLIPSAQINDGGYTGQQMYDSVLRYASYQGFIKPNGFLCEPSHCAHCFFIYLMFLLFEDNGENNKKNMRYAILISVAMVATMSTSAFLQLALAWVAWMIVGKRKNILQVVGVLTAIVAVVIFLTTRGSSSTFVYVIERFTNLFNANSTVSNSSNLRVLKGIEVFNSVPVINKIFGIGFGSYEAAVSSGIIASTTVDLSNEYMNSLSYILVSAGILGFIIFISYFVSIFRNRQLLGKLLIVGLVIMFMGTSTYCTAIFVWMMLLINNLEVGIDDGRFFDT